MVTRFLEEKRIHQGEPVAIYSAPKNTLTVERWHKYTQAIKDCGGKPVILVSRSHRVDLEIGADFQERLGVEIISVDEWVKRGGTYSG